MSDYIAPEVGLFGADPSRPGDAYIPVGGKALRVVWDANDNAAVDSADSPEIRYTLDSGEKDAAGEMIQTDGPPINHVELHRWKNTYRGPDPVAAPVNTPPAGPVALPDRPGNASVVDQTSHNEIHGALTELAKVTPVEHHGFLWTIAHRLGFV